jgi:pimeloyl-ACP methyl ester carboxylesterase
MIAQALQEYSIDKEKNMICTIQGLPLHYVEHGEGMPVVLLHGFMPDHRLMTGAMEPVFALQPGYRRIYLDLPGMGKTPGADWITSSDHILQLVRDCIDTLLPGQDFLLAGQSYGGYLAQGLALAWPERVAGLMLLCPVTVPAFPQRDLPPHQVMLRDEAAMQRADLNERQRQDFDGIAVIQNEATWARTRDEIFSGLQVADKDFLQGLRARGLALSAHPPALRRAYDKPALIFCGRQDAVVGHRDAWPLQEYYSRASFVSLDMCGHHAHIEAPHVFQAMAEDWLLRCTAFSQSKQ